MRTAVTTLLAFGATILLFGLFDGALARNPRFRPREGTPADRRQEAERAIAGLRRSSPFMVRAGLTLIAVALVLVLIAALT